MSTGSAENTHSSTGHPQIEWVDDELADSTIIGVWSTMNDEFVRPSHRAVEGQERRVDIPFDVGGHKLRFPGDTSLGAPSEETDGCRCCVHFFAVGPDGSRLDLGVPTPRIFQNVDNKRTPTLLVTLNGTTRARVVLSDSKTLAYLRQATPTTIVVTVDRRQIARAVLSGRDVTSCQIDPKYTDLGIADLIRRSAEHSYNRTR